MNAQEQETFSFQVEYLNPCRLDKSGVGWLRGGAGVEVAVQAAIKIPSGSKLGAPQPQLDSINLANRALTRLYFTRARKGT